MSYTLSQYNATRRYADKHKKRKLALEMIRYYKKKVKEWEEKLNDAD